MRTISDRCEAHAQADDMAQSAISRTLTRRIPVGSQLVLAMSAAALAPMMALIAVGYAFFYDDPSPQLSFEYWTFLVVVWVLGIAFLVARLVAGGITRQLDSVASAAGSRAVAASRPTSNDFEALEEKFNQIEAVVAEGRAASLGRIKTLEEEVERLREAADLHAQFLSAISHEIRTPLSAIVSSARIIQRYHEKQPDVVERFGNTIVVEGKRLVDQVSDMLDLVKIESGRIEWRDAELSATRLVDRVVAHFADTCSQHELDLEVDVDPDVPVGWGDEGRIEQVVSNLVRNAVKFTTRGGRIAIHGRKAAEGGLWFTVEDTGMGIKPDELDGIFERSQVFKRRKRNGGKQAGTGLGLALCREIVLRHGGTIWAESRLGAGSAFHFTVPAAEAGLGTRGYPTAATEADGIKVLLLIPNEVLADCAVRALRLEDVDNRVCTNLQEFFAVLPEWTPDVVVVSPTFAWQLTDKVEQRIRKAGVPHILMFSPHEGFVELSPPTHSEPLLGCIGRHVAHGSRILLVEDDEEYGAVIEFELIQAGYDVIKAFNGVDALSTFADQSPDAIVLDLALPQLDGFSVLAELRARGVHVPTIVLTALDDVSLDDRLRDLGAAGVFRKYELIQARAGSAATRVKKILSPVLASSAAEADEGPSSYSNSA